MEEIINKPESQFKDILNDLIDYSKDSEEKSALIKEVCSARHPTKPAASLNSSIYSSSSSSTSSASDSSTNSASSSSTSSTLSSPSQSNQGDSDAKNGGGSNPSYDVDKIEVAKMEHLGKTARILEHRLATNEGFRTATNAVGKVAGTASHSYNRSISLNSISPLPSSSSNLPQSLAHHSEQQTSITHISSRNSNVTSWNSEQWKTISGKRDKRRKKPVEQPVLSQHIPGHKGEQEVEWLVKFIESGPPGPSNISSSTSKKVTKNTKQQSKRLPSQTMERERENLQRKPNNKLTTTHIRPLQQSKQVSGSDQTQLQPATQRKAQAISNDSQPQQSGPQKTVLQPTNDGKYECEVLEIKRPHNPQRERESVQDEAIVTFADHICINDDEASSNGRYIFGFFNEQQPQTNNQVKQNKPATKLNEDSPNSSKPKRVSQKHKLKHPKASLNSEQKRYKFNDNIDANSFNYHQILEFISNSWESTANSRRQNVKHAGSF